MTAETLLATSVASGYGAYCAPQPDQTPSATNGADQKIPHAVRTLEDLRTATTNVCLMRLLERVAARFNQAGIPLMALKGAALNLVLFDRPEQRPMTDIDLLVKPENVSGAIAAMESCGCRRGRPLVRADFFPRFHYEMEFLAGTIYPMRIDLHVRPFRPLRYARTVPEDAFWERAERVAIGRAHVLIPSDEDMLIHLAVHSAIHGNRRTMWLADLKHWVESGRTKIDWAKFLHAVRDWGLVLPVREALAAAERVCGLLCPPHVHARLGRRRIGWRERLALAQAPRDAAHPAAHLAADALCTPGVRFVLSYLWAALVPDRRHMGDWYAWRHIGWLPCAHLLRLASPVLRHMPNWWLRIAKADLRDTATRGTCLVASRDLRARELIAHADRHGGGLPRHAHHSCRPNAELRGGGLRTLRAIEAGREITIDRGPGACDCKHSQRDQEHKTSGDTTVSQKKEMR